LHAIRYALDHVAEKGCDISYFKALFNGVPSSTYFSFEHLDLQYLARPDVCAWLELLAKHRNYITLRDFDNSNEAPRVISTLRGVTLKKTGMARLEDKDHLTKNTKVDAPLTLNQKQLLVRMLQEQTTQDAASSYLNKNLFKKADQFAIDRWIMYAFFRRTSKLGIDFATTKLGGVAFNEASTAFYKLGKLGKKKSNIDISKGLALMEARVAQDKDKRITLSEYRHAKNSPHSKTIIFYSEGGDAGAKLAKQKSFKRYFMPSKSRHAGKIDKLRGAVKGKKPLLPPLSSIYKSIFRIKKKFVFIHQQSPIEECYSSCCLFFGDTWGFYYFPHQSCCVQFAPGRQPIVSLDFFCESKLR